MLKAEVPGVQKDDIKVAIDGNQVSITAEVKKEDQQKNGNMVRSERYYGQQYRSFNLPQEVDEANAEARCHDGILELMLPKNWRRWQDAANSVNRHACWTDVNAGLAFPVASCGPDMAAMLRQSDSNPIMGLSDLCRPADRDR